MGATLFVKPAHVVAQPMLAPVAWGNSDWGGDTTVNNDDDMTGVVQVSCGNKACAGIKPDRSVVTWGLSTHGGDTTLNNNDGVTDMDKVACGDAACAGLKTDGSVVAWGSSSYGGDMQGEDVADVAQIVCGGGGCAGLKTNGSVVAWGHSAFGGSTQGKDMNDVAQIVCGGSACAGLKKDASVVAWGHSGYGADFQGQDVTSIAQLVCGRNACAALKTNGSVVAWGDSGQGGSTQGKDMNDVAQIVCGGGACAGLKDDTSVVAWGHSGLGGSAPADLTGVAQVVCGRNACAALKIDGSVVAWGDSGKGGSAPAGLTDVAQIVCGGSACAGLKNNGSVVAWGNNGLGGSAPADLIGANQITCVLDQCVAWYASDTAGGGGDPHFIGFGGIYFTWQGHCDLVLVKATNQADVDTDFEVHIRTTKVRKWSKIDAIAIKVGQDVGEISSENGMLILNGHEVNKVQQQSLTVAKSNLNGNNILYVFLIDGDKKLEIKVNTRTQMIFTSLSGNYSQNTEGILGSPHQPGFISRKGDHISSANVNAFAETWQVRDNDPRLFSTNRIPQYPSKCVYDVKKKPSSHHTRHLKELHHTTKDEAISACSNHHPGPLQNFCVDDVIMTGDLDAAKDEFYE